MDSSLFINKARLHWTKDRVQKITGGKKLLITPDEAPMLLRVMGLLNSDSSMSANDIRKYRQINHMLALIGKDLEQLCTTHDTLRLVDIGCGNSYLSLLIAWYFQVKHPHPVQILGLDVNDKVIAASRQRAQELGFQGLLKFHCGKIEDQDAWISIWESLFPSSSAPQVQVVLALHACDTASDEALNLGIQMNAEFMAIAPCCQAELAQKWKGLSQSESLHPLFSSRSFRRSIAADVTDLYRTLLVRSCGYEVTATEFVPSEHSLKNRILICKKRGHEWTEARQQYEAVKSSFGGVGIRLEELVGQLRS